MNALVFLSLSLLGQSSLDDGSLIFLENCHYFVERYTQAPIGHVAVAVVDGNDTWIYEATPGRVRRLTWADYRSELAKINADRHRRKKDPIVAWVLEPEENLSEDESASLESYLESQLDRRYSVRGILRGKPSDGVHCAELASQAMNATGRYSIEDCHKQSPAALMDIVRSNCQREYQASIAPPSPQESWCDRQWRRWTHWGVMCRWSLGEAWRFCW